MYGCNNDCAVSRKPVVVPLAAAYLGGQYIVERMRWNIKGKEEVFKQQFVAHVKEQLQLIVDEISVDCSHQVEQ